MCKQNDIARFFYNFLFHSKSSEKTPNPDIASNTIGLIVILPAVVPHTTRHADDK